MDDDLRDYRKHLLLAEEETQRIYDRTLITLASAGLGISFALVGNNPSLSKGSAVWLLILSWASWGLTLIVVLVSHLVSQKFLRKAIEQVDEGTIREQIPGGPSVDVIDRLNYFAGALFFVGVFLFAIFISQDLGGN